MRALILYFALMIFCPCLSQINVPKLFEEIIMQELDYNILYSPTYRRCNVGIKEISYCFNGFSSDSIKISPCRILKENLFPKPENCVTLYYNHQGYLYGSSDGSDKETYFFYQTQDSLIVEGEKYRETYVLNERNVAEDFLGIKNYSERIICDSIFITNPNYLGVGSMTYVFTRKDSLFVKKYFTDSAGTKMTQRHYYDYKNRRIQSLKWYYDNNGASPSYIEKYYYNEKDMLTHKETFELINKNLVKTKQYDYYYNKRANLKYVIFDSIKPTECRYGAFIFTYRFYNKKYQKNYNADFSHSKRLFFNPE